MSTEIKECPKFIKVKGYSESARKRRHLQAMSLWAYQNGVKIDFSRPGKPMDNRRS
jgi:hypothetical protein